VLVQTTEVFDPLLQSPNNDRSSLSEFSGKHDPKSEKISIYHQVYFYRKLFTIDVTTVVIIRLETKSTVMVDAIKTIVLQRTSIIKWAITDCNILRLDISEIKSNRDENERTCNTKA